MPEPTYDYHELADRIEAVLGRRPSLSLLRAAGADGRRWKTAARRITAKMPLPLPKASPHEATRFLQVEIEDWLLKHPMVIQRREQERLVLALREGRVEEGIRDARVAGISWQQISAAWAAAKGNPRSASGLHRKYRYLDPQ